jgi:hypothetical protein
MLALGQPSAQAATITVNSSCTLVDAITAANTDTATGGCPAGNGADTIVLPAGSQQILSGANNSNYGPTGLPVISSTITIAGNRSTILGNGYSFRVLAVNQTGDLTLRETTVSGGRASSSCCPPSSNGVVESSGGGIANFGGTLTLMNSTISGNHNSAFYGYNRSRYGGGGVANFGGSLAILNSTISDNNAYGIGGGIANFGGSVTVLNSTISRNDTFLNVYASGYAGGGGVANLGTGSLTVLNSTISGNSASINCNEAHCFGADAAAVLNYSDGTVTLMNTTITGNHALANGGVRNVGMLALVHTLIAGNIDVFGRPSEVSNYGTLLADNHNLIGVNGNAAVSGFTPGPTDIVPPAGVQIADILDPTLAGNGGPTRTHALVPGSPAIDGGSTDCTDATGAPLTTDQRGMPRPIDANGDGIRDCDIGVFESPPVAKIDIQPGISPNRINPKSKGFIRVAILTTKSFDPTTVDPATIRFGPKGATVGDGQSHMKDVDKDGDLDLVLQFRTQDTGITCGALSASLTGQTFDGQTFMASDSIKTIGCNPGPIAYWSFDDGTARDNSGNGFDGEILGDPPTVIPGIRGNALQFGSGFIEVVGDELGMTRDTERTISLWANASSLPEFRHGFISKCPSFEPQNCNYFALMLLGENNQIVTRLAARLTGQETDVIDVTAGEFGKWQHFVFVMKDGVGETKVYRNGVLAAQGTLTYSDAISSGPLTIGKNGATGGPLFFGALDEIRIYDRVLTENEIRALFLSRSAGKR